MGHQRNRRKGTGALAVKAELVGHGAARDERLNPVDHYLIARITEGPKAFIGRQVEITLGDDENDIGRMGYRSALDDMLAEQQAKQAKA